MDFDRHDVDNLYRFAKSIISEDKEKARKIFHMCYELNPKHIPSYNQLLIEAISNSNYALGYEYLKNNRILKFPDHNFYLYLFSYLTDVSIEDREYIEYLDYEDIIHYNSSENNYDNIIRYNVINGDFRKALAKSYLKRENNLDNKLFSSDIIVNLLLREIVKNDNLIKKNIDKCIKSNNVVGIVDILSKEYKKHPLRQVHECIYEIANDILIMNKTGIISKKEDNYNEEDIFSMIYAHQYTEAKKFQKRYSNDLEGKNEYNKQIKFLLDIAIKEEENINNKLIDEQKQLQESINSKIDSLTLSNPIIILDNLDDISYNYVFKLANKKEDIEALDYTENSVKRIIVKRNLDNQKKFDYKKSLNIEKNAYEDGKYSKAFIESKKMLCYFAKPPAYLYAHIGDCCDKLKNYMLALEYYKLAAYFAKKENDRYYDYYEEEIDIIEHKIIMSTIRIQNEKEEKKKYESIYDSILYDNLTLDAAINKYNLSERDINFLKLITVKRLYANKNFKAGDKLFNEIEKSKFKDQAIDNILIKTKKKKNFYQYKDMSKEYIN